MFWRIVNIILVVLLVGSVIGGYFYGQERFKAGQSHLEAKVKEAYDQGYKAYEDPNNPGPKIKALETLVKELKTGLAVAPKPLRDLTYAELMDFVKRDQTNKTPYSFPNYYAFHFASDFFNAAQREGIRVGYVILRFLGGKLLALNAFRTTDRGLIFIEPQLDQVVKVEKGRGYWEQNSWTSRPGFDDTIVEVLLVGLEE